MKDERGKQLRLVPQLYQGIPNVLTQVIHVCGCQVAQSAILGPGPNLLVWIAVGGMAGEVLHYHFGVLCQPRLDHPRLAVNLVLIPHDRPGAAHLTLELPQEQHHLLAVEVLVFAQEHEVQPHAQRPGAERYGAYHTDSVVLVRAHQYRCLAARGHRASGHGRQQKARFVQQSDASATLERLADDAWPVVVYPTFHLLVVTSAGMFLRLLAGPLKASVEDAVDVGGVITNGEVPLDHQRDALAGPQVVGPTVSHSPFVERGFQTGQLLVVESRFGTKGRLGSKAVALTSQASPAPQRGAGDAKDPSDDVGRLPRFDQGNGSQPTPFQLSACPFWSHTSFYARTGRRSSPAQSSVGTTEGRGVSGGFPSAALSSCRL